MNNIAGEEVAEKEKKPSMDAHEVGSGGSVFIVSWEEKPNRSQTSSARRDQREPTPRPIAEPQSSSAENPGSKAAHDRLSEPQIPPAASVTATRPSTPQHSSAQNQTSKAYHTPRAMRTPKGTEWTEDKIANELSKCARDVQRDHGRLVKFRLEEAAQKAREPRHLSEVDFFADMSPAAISVDDDNPLPESVVTVKFKQFTGDTIKTKGPKKTSYFEPVGIKTDREAVPRYKFHHVEVPKNILTPNTMLNFVPHLRDMEPQSNDEIKYLKWIEELSSLDTQSGFKTEDKASKLAKRTREEYAATLSMYLDRWIKYIGVEGLIKAALIRFMAAQASENDVITPQQKSSILDHRDEDADSSRSMMLAKMFTRAFDRVFDNHLNGQTVMLSDILRLDKSLEIVADNKRVKDTPSSQKQDSEDLLERVETALASYAILGCSICFSHDCEHGEFFPDNQRRAFSVDGITVPMLLKKKYEDQLRAKEKSGANVESGSSQPCKNQCYRSYDVGNHSFPIRLWSDREIQVLESVFAALGHSEVKPQCQVAIILNRNCWDVYRKIRDLGLELPHVDIPEPVRVKPVSWYDRNKKQLIGDWQDNTLSHEHAQREIIEPCHHEGPCGPKCPCVRASLLCERFCFCTAENCAQKFTGCACHSTGKTCLQRQKEGRPCVCIQLNRECDPTLCKGCGAGHRANPENAHDDVLHSTGCQNVALQRGLAKKLLLGKSQLEGCGYGCFTAEDITQDEFVIEYTGEIITHDEGVRREARRGNVFDESSNSSYLFTLLELEGIWVDAAIYGNLSRYINHASEGDRKGSNITPKILYVNGEFRIRFSALRDIKAGEELFFNYGDNFPNLTKKLLEEDQNKDDPTTGQKRKAGRPPKAKTGAKEANQLQLSKAKGHGRATKIAPGATGVDESEDDPMNWATDPLMGLAFDDENLDDEWAEDLTPRRKKKRGGRRPGAGRKPKRVLDAERERELELVGLDNDEDEDFMPEIGDSQDETTDRIGADDSLSPRRKSRRQRSSTDLRRGVLDQANGTGASQESPKPASRRGGARPGAGRKPKKHKQAPSLVTRVNSDGEEEPGSKSISLISHASIAPTSNRPPAVGGARRPRKGGTLDSDIEMIDPPAYGEPRFELMDEQSEDEEDEDNDHDEEMDDDDDDDVVDRTSRKRQKPARYRDSD